MYIDEKFKDDSPENTVNRIIDVLKDIGIELSERENNSKIENCCSFILSAPGGIPSSNGKGITREFARASAYGEFIERLQSGLFFYKYQSFENDDSVYLHSFAPDKRYMSYEELLENSEWMEPITKRYNITKEHIAEHCLIYACSDKVLTLPFYSLFEDKYVYLPAAFVEHIYSANGCCVGNTREEAFVHALSEIFERHSNIEVISSGKNVPVIPREKLREFKVVNAILEKIESKGIYNVDILDYSCGKKFPVVAARIINKKTKDYLVNVGADPVFEIAVERTLTEIFQGRNLDNFSSYHHGKILNKLDDIRLADNIMNQLETGNGQYTADFFADIDSTVVGSASFPDNSGKNNRQLADFTLGLYKEMGLNVYVRNNSFLGFPCYKFVVPGFSESRGERLKEVVPTYYFADLASKVLRNIKAADDNALNELLLYHTMVTKHFRRAYSFNVMAGIPLYDTPMHLALVHLAYAALKLNNRELFDYYIDGAITFASQYDEDDSDYFAAIKQWYTFKNNGVSKEKALAVIKKFYFEKTYTRFCNNLEGEAFFDEFLLNCTDCSKCQYKNNCCYDSIRAMMKKAGAEYAKFTDGQNRENFIY